MKQLIALSTMFACLCLVGSAVAGGGTCSIHPSVIYGATPYYAPTYVEPVVVVQYVAVPLAVPTFSITYGAYAGAPQATATTSAPPAAAESEVAQLRADMLTMNKKLDGIVQFLTNPDGGPPNTPTNTPPTNTPPKKEAPVKVAAGKARPELAKHPGVAILNKRCASCHEAQKATEFGGGIVLSRGADFVTIDAEVSKAAVRAILHGKMPKGQPRLPGEEPTQIIDLLTTQ